MAKKRPAKKSSKKAETKAQDEQIVLGLEQEKALRLIDKSAKVRGALEQAVGLAIAKAVRKCMKENKIALTAPEASELAAIWFGECDD